MVVVALCCPCEICSRLLLVHYFASPCRRFCRRMDTALHRLACSVVTLHGWNKLLDCDHVKVGLLPCDTRSQGVRKLISCLLVDFYFCCVWASNSWSGCGRSSASVLVSTFWTLTFEWSSKVEGDRKGAPFGSPLAHFLTPNAWTRTQVYMSDYLAQALISTGAATPDGRSRSGPYQPLDPGR